VTDALDSYLRTPLHLATSCFLVFNYNTSEHLDTIRLFVEGGYNDPMQLDRGGRPSLFTQHNQALHWLLNQDSFYVDPGYKAPLGLNLLE